MCTVHWLEPHRSFFVVCPPAIHYGERKTPVSDPFARLCGVFWWELSPNRMISQMFRAQQQRKNQTTQGTQARFEDGTLISPFSTVIELCSFKKRRPKKPLFWLAMSPVLSRIWCTLGRTFAHNALLKMNAPQTWVLTLYLIFQL